MVAIQVIAVVGFLLSVYALYVEHKVKKDAGYKAVCDITDNMSCGKVLTSKYGSLTGISNAIGGLLFYPLVFVLALLDYGQIILYLAVLAIIGSAYLAYLQYFKLKNLCLVCSGIYVVNILLLVFSL